mmetsp:Transcript_38857/g.72924  ORF Transcript_38857/g.72924 Transcript_38857/m.72924 type:complete len:386 (-) Transcript_38857:903-2060(-)
MHAGGLQHGGHGVLRGPGGDAGQHERHLRGVLQLQRAPPGQRVQRPRSGRTGDGERPELWGVPGRAGADGDGHQLHLFVLQLCVLGAALPIHLPHGGGHGLQHARHRHHHQLHGRHPVGDQVHRLQLRAPQGVRVLRGGHRGRIGHHHRAELWHQRVPRHRVRGRGVAQRHLPHERRGVGRLHHGRRDGGVEPGVRNRRQPNQQHRQRLQLLGSLHHGRAGGPSGHVRGKHNHARRRQLRGDHHQRHADFAGYRGVTYLHRLVVLRHHSQHRHHMRHERVREPVVRRGRAQPHPHHRLPVQRHLRARPAGVWPAYHHLRLRLRHGHLPARLPELLCAVLRQAGDCGQELWERRPHHPGRLLPGLRVLLRKVEHRAVQRRRLGGHL